MKSVICYINQFFAGIGGEDKADFEPEVRQGVVGPTGAINMGLKAYDAQVTYTVICGDNFMSTHRDEAIERILKELEDKEFDLFLAGPAFQAGRYGVACGEIGKAVEAKFGVPVITSMHAENPGVEMFKKDMYIMKGSHSAASMKNDADMMVALAGKILKGEEIEGPDAEGYYQRGIRHQVWRKDGVMAADRAVDMLIAKATGKPFVSELIIPKKDLVPIAPALKDLSKAKIALTTTGGIVPVDNPDRIQSASATRWGRYDISEMDRLESGVFKTIHAGFDPAAANADPNVIMPVDVMKEYLKEGKIGSIHKYFYSTVGTGTTQGEAKRMAKEIIPLLQEDNVDAVIMVST